MIDRDRLARLHQQEEQRFIDQHPRSAELAAEARGSLLAGVPMPWMTRWPGSFPLFVDSAVGGRFTDVDGIEYVDLCLGDTGSMTGHCLPAVAEAVRERTERGITTMLPSTDATWVAEELARRFDLPLWQMAMTATDANRFVLRFARHLTGRPRIAVMDWCYHGTVDETLAVLEHGRAGDRVVARPGALGPQVDVALTTAVVPFNDLDALDRRLAEGDVACLLMEPALTNIGIVLPDEGYLAGVREVTRRHGVLLVNDETHTICAGPGGATAAWGLDPDFVVMGKPIGGGIPVAAYGMTAEVADRLSGPMLGHEIDVAGVGGTLSGSALAMAAVRATLSTALRQEDFDVAIPLAARFTEGIQRVIDQRELPWHVQRLGCRAEYWFCPPPHSGAEAAAAVDEELDAFMHLWTVNRGVLLAPFHNMSLFSQFHTEADVDRHTQVFAEAVAALVG
jgi:glutamate-1-semialdehyde 2,1-aminomutase